MSMPEAATTDVALTLTDIRNIAALWMKLSPPPSSWSMTVNGESVQVTKDQVLNSARILLGNDFFKDSLFKNFDTPDEWAKIYAEANVEVQDQTKFDDNSSQLDPATLEALQKEKAAADERAAEETSSPWQTRRTALIQSYLKKGLSLDQAIRLAEMEGTTASRAPSAHVGNAPVNLAPSQSRTPSGEAHPKSISAASKRELELLAERARLNPTRFRQNPGGWFGEKVFNPFRDYRERVFSSWSRVFRRGQSEGESSLSETPQEVAAEFSPTPATPSRPRLIPSLQKRIGYLFSRGEQPSPPSGAPSSVSKMPRPPAPPSASTIKSAGSQAAEAGVKKITQKLATKAVGAVALPLAIGLTLLSNPEVRRLVATAASSVAIGLHFLLQWLMANLVTGVSTLAGAALGAVVGTVVIPIPIVGTLVGAAAGGIAGYFLGQTLSSLFVGGGATTAISGGTAAAVTTTSAATTLVSVGSAGAIATLGIGTALGTAGGVSLITGMETGEIFRDYPLLSTTPIIVEKVVDRPFLDNDPSGQAVTYTVRLINKTTTDLEIEIKDHKAVDYSGRGTFDVPMPPAKDTLPTKLTKENTRNNPLVITYNPLIISNAPDRNFNDSSLVNTIEVVVTDPAAGTTTLVTGDATVKIGNPSTAFLCPLAPEGNPCAASNLLPYFDNDPAKADIASRICYRESRGRPDALNDGCTDNPKRHNEYSVGLFQINLFARDSLCRELSPTGENPFLDPYNYKTGGGDACVRKQSLLDQCRAFWTSQNKKCDTGDGLMDCNIRLAYVISKGGTNWWPWSTSRPNVCNVQQTPR